MYPPATCAPVGVARIHGASILIGPALYSWANGRRQREQGEADGGDARSLTAEPMRCLPCRLPTVLTLPVPACPHRWPCGAPGFAGDAAVRRSIRPYSLRALRIERRQPLARGGADAALGDQPGDEPRRRHVEGVVAGRAAGGGDLDAARPCRPRCARVITSTSSAPRSSMGMSAPESSVQSMVECGSAT